MIIIKYYIVRFAQKTFRKFPYNEIVYNIAELEIKRIEIANCYKLNIDDITFVYIEHDVKLIIEAIKNV